MFGLFCLLILFPNQDIVTAAPAREDVNLIGYTRARDVLTVSPELAARCVRVLADMGEVIPADGIFASLDDTFSRLKLEANQSRQAQLEDHITYLEKETNRFADLLKQATISQSAFDELDNRLSQVRLERLVLAVEAKSLQETIARHQLRAPAGWKVISRDLVPGSWVTPGTMLAKVGNYNELVVPFALSREQLNWLQTNAKNLQLTLPDDEDQQVQGRILRISPEFDEVSRKTTVHLIIEKGMPQWRGGIRVALTISSAGAVGVVELPANALENRYEAWWVTREDGSQLRVSHLGTTESGLIRIKSPAIKAGDRFRVSNKL